ncbi:MAG TPA: enoyl-CoA hydratase-related protein [Syntrophales bacterium]|nr:enoyl-CoA hydratase-related protein [Syntrophales bacterium]
MSDYQTIILEEKGALCVLTLNKPESRNPLTEETKIEIISALDYVEKTQGIRAVIITGRGVAFCAGGDIKNIGRELAPDEIREVMLKSQRLLKKLLGIEKPVIAAVNGDAFGMGFNLALAADFIIASEKARFSEVFIKIGSMADFGALYFLPRLIGTWKSKELVYTGKIIDAREAERIGLVYRVTSQEELEKEAIELAGRLAEMPTKAIGRAKRVLDRSFCMELDEVLDAEIEGQIYLSQTEDFREGMRALLEKRKPKFRGK